MYCQKDLSLLKLSRKYVTICEIIGLVAITTLTTGPTSRAAGEVNPAFARSEARGWTNGSCGTCHAIDPLISHPVGVVPSMSIPAHLPLENGRVTCITCHRSDSAAHAEARTQADPMLRGERTGTAFCTQCHNTLDHSRRSQHPLALGRAHLASRGIRDMVETAASGRFDAETNLCLSCHDGLMASDAGVSPTRFNDLPGDHPVGVSMRQDQTSMSSDDAMRAPHSLDRRIRLFNDNVGCGSCHSPYSTEKSLLVMSNRGSQLCLSCHVP